MDIPNTLTGNDLVWDNCQMLAQRILDDTTESYSHAIDKNDEKSIRIIQRRLNNTEWCNILGITPQYVYRKAKNYKKYTDYKIKHRGE